jgi:hypothetical protein|tara:strand:+ start:8737 stop:9177 length:441 start_codon:yes stop_codon:yes gene_type:complete
MADVSPNIQILGDNMSEACVCVNLPASADTATIDLNALAMAAGDGSDRVAITGIQSNGSFNLKWDSDSDYAFFFGSGNVNIPMFISPIIMDQGRAGDNPTGDIIVTASSTNVFIMIKLKKIAGFKGSSARFKKLSGAIASDGIGGY